VDYETDDRGERYELNWVAKMVFQFRSRHLQPSFSRSFVVWCMRRGQCGLRTDEHLSGFIGLNVGINTAGRRRVQLLLCNLYRHNTDDEPKKTKILSPQHRS
jgi:hypothetical protein